MDSEHAFAAVLLASVALVAPVTGGLAPTAPGAAAVGDGPRVGETRTDCRQRGPAAVGGWAGAARPVLRALNLVTEAGSGRAETPTTIRNESLGVAVTATGRGTLGRRTTVSAPDRVMFRDRYAPDATVTPFAAVESPGELARVEVAFAYDDAAVAGPESALALYRFDERTGRYERLNATVDARRDRVTATVSDGGVFVVADARAWNRTAGSRHALVAPNATASRDADGDGIPDGRERAGVPLAGGPVVALDATDPDTDGDGLSDGREVAVADRRSVGPGARAAGFAWTSDPTVADTDGDGLSDAAEVTGNWSRAGVARSGTRVEPATGSGEPFRRWAPAGGTTVTFTADPRTPHSDDDGLNDRLEVARTHTDPRDAVTYERTRRHRRLLADVFLDVPRVGPRVTSRELRTARRIGLVGPDGGRPALVAAVRTLDDGSDDFDFVAGTGRTERGLDRLAFTGLNGSALTDVWLSNRAEAARTRTDPWDPDADDDGLTDGQELAGIPVVQCGPLAPAFVRREAVGTSPVDPDTDGDGYWDGWIGVRNVSYTRGRGIGQADDVVLYREHLSGGVEGGETVPGQKRLHDAAVAPTGASADVDGDGRPEHANVHVGELHWRQVAETVAGDPTDPSVAPTPRLTVEVDYYAGVDWSRAALRRVLSDASDSYALYGLNVTFVVDERIAQAELESYDRSAAGDPPLVLPPQTVERNETDEPPFTGDEAEDVEDAFHDAAGTAYAFVATQGSDETGRFGSFAHAHGVASSQGFDGFFRDGVVDGFDWGIVLFAGDHAGPARFANAQKTLVHEVGHLLGAGRGDDGRQYAVLPREVYSGSPGDPTPEEVGYGPALGPESDDWSAMSRGNSPVVRRPPMSGEYVAYSVEELLTVEFTEIDSRE